MSSDDHNNFSISRKIVLAAIVSLFAVTILVIILSLYARYLLRRQERRRRRVSLYPATTEVAPADHELNFSDINPPKTGLDSSIISSLPIFVYKSMDRLGHGEAVECSVCLSTIVEEATVRILPNCKHLFHAECIDTWLSSHLTCPICRTMAEPRVEPGHSEFGSGVWPTAPPLEESGLDGVAVAEKVGGSGSRLSSFRRMMSGERSSRSIQSCEEVGADDHLERLWVL